jgi:putative ABC transport system permease protein
MSITDEAKALGMEGFAEKLVEDGLVDKASRIAVFRQDKVNEKKNDSMLKAVNGCLSIGFVATLTVAFVGFVFFWIMNVRKRKLQFGILRAMGLTKGKLALVLIWEHLLTTGTSVIVGTVVGAFTVRIFAPLLKVPYNDGVLPLEVLFNRGDNVKIFMVVGLMLAAGIVVLACYIGKLKINEAVKIGEE